MTHRDHIPGWYERLRPLIIDRAPEQPPAQAAAEKALREFERGDHSLRKQHDQRIAESVAAEAKRCPLPSGCFVDASGVWGRIAVAARVAWSRCGVVRQALRWIAPGEFLMGSPDDELDRSPKEGPQHRVRITRGFWMADTVCTQELWQAVMGENPSRDISMQRPVTHVSWDDVQEFLRQLIWMLGGHLKADLPTEAEWEYACRAGTTTAYSFGNVPSPERVACNRKCPVPVKGLPPNAWGLYEMHGNVWELCADGRRDYAANVDPIDDPRGPAEYACARGGSWIHDAHTARSAARNWVGRRVRGDLLGFRFVLRAP